MKDCCLSEIDKSLKKHRDAATCDGCGNLLIAYGHEGAYEKTCKELERHEVVFDTMKKGRLFYISKSR